jgi:hypothetical protein
MLLLVFCTKDNNNEDEIIGNKDIQIKVVFPYFEVTEARVCYESNWGDSGYLMLNENDSSYSYMLNEYAGSTFLFDIYCKTSFSCRNEIWVPSSTGIAYAKVYVNNVLLDNSYLVYNYNLSGLNFYLQIHSNGTIGPYSDAGSAHKEIDARIQPEVPWITHYSIPTSNYPSTSTHRAVKVWLQALHDYRYPASSSQVEVDYIELFKKIGNQNVSIAREDYNGSFTGDEGGLYKRYPFFCDDSSTIMPTTIESGILKFAPSDNQRKVFHFWIQPGSERVAGDSYYALAKVKITGPASIQIGMDFTPDSVSDSNHIEIGASDWYFDSSAWQDVIFDPAQ